MSFAASMEYHPMNVDKRMVRSEHMSAAYQYPSSSSSINDGHLRANSVQPNGTYADENDRRFVAVYTDEIVSSYADDDEIEIEGADRLVAIRYDEGAAPVAAVPEIVENGLEDDEYPSTSYNGTMKTDSHGFRCSDQNVFAEPTVPLTLSTFKKRERKWLHMLENWPYYMNKKFDVVKARCRKGIPGSVRARAWAFLCGAQYHMESSKDRTWFEYLDQQEGDPRWVDDIQKDIYRQFPDHEIFARESPYGHLGRDDLFRLLKAYTVHFDKEGYCQGQAPVAAVLLMHMPLKDAFYCFVQICTTYLPGYYSPGLEAIQLDGDIIFKLLKYKAPLSYKHLKKHHIDPVLYMVEWFMCIFCRTLPWSSVLRVWDMFFCEGVKVLFKVAVVLFRHGLGTRTQLKECDDLASTVERLKRLPPEILGEEFLVARITELQLKEEDLERIHYKQVKTRAKAKKKLNKSS